MLQAHRMIPDDFPSFSASELLECLARFWDVHTRNPRTIAEEESLRISKPLEIDGRIVYTQKDYDVVMQQGKNSQYYAEPYRWMLEQVAGDSYFINLVFPIIAFWSFTTLEPIKVFWKAFEKIKNSKTIHQKISETRTDNINIDWLTIWPEITRDIMQPVLSDAFLSSSTGFDVIQNTELSIHPIMKYCELGRSALAELVQKFKSLGSKVVPRDHYTVASRLEALLASEDGVFAMPGQPNYRYLLGHSFLPPRIRFNNSEIYSPLFPLNKNDYDDLEKRIQNFKNARREV